MPAPKISYASPARSSIQSALIRGLERVTGRRQMETRYAATQALNADTFWEGALDQLDVTLDADPDPSTVVPTEGPLVVVANHPFGVLDGLAICHLVSLVRSDFRILVNRVLCRDDRIEHHFLPIDFTESRAARGQNVRSMKAAFDHLRDDGVLIIFPAGGVATATRPFGPVEEMNWKPLLARLVHEGEAPVLPVYFAGRNSRLFHLVSQVSLTLRLSLLLRETLQKAGETLSVRLGSPVSYGNLASLTAPNDLARRLRSTTLGLNESGPNAEESV
ncbi:MAG: lysophospholipid acyltransferase family protein [Salinibacter sp.]